MIMTTMTMTMIWPWQVFMLEIASDGVCYSTLMCILIFYIVCSYAIVLTMICWSLLCSVSAMSTEDDYHMLVLFRMTIVVFMLFMDVRSSTSVWNLFTDVVSFCCHANWQYFDCASWRVSPIWSKLLPQHRAFLFDYDLGSISIGSKIVHLLRCLECARVIVSSNLPNSNDFLFINHAYYFWGFKNSWPFPRWLRSIASSAPMLLHLTENRQTPETVVLLRLANYQLSHTGASWIWAKTCWMVAPVLIRIVDSN